MNLVNKKRYLLSMLYYKNIRNSLSLYSKYFRLRKGFIWNYCVSNVFKFGYFLY